MSLQKIKSLIRLSLLLTFLASSSLLSCSQCGNLITSPKVKKTVKGAQGLESNNNQVKGLTNGPEQSRPGNNQSGDSHRDDKSLNERGDKSPNAAIVVLHGINDEGASWIKELMGQLHKDIKTDKKVITLSITIPKSGHVSTEKQADQVYQRIVDQGLKGIPVFLIGDSHGGVVLGKVAQKYGGQLRIARIITNHSPHEGAPGLEIIANNDKDGKLATLVNEAIGLPINLSILLAKFVQGYMSSEVITELTPGSQLLRDARVGLSSKGIKVLLLGGKIENLNDPSIIQLMQNFSGKLPLFGFTQSIQDAVPKLVKKDAFVKSVAEVLGKDHDFLVPLESQLAKNTLTSSNIQRRFYDGYHHFYGIKSHPQAYKDMVSFINEGLREIN